MTGRNVPYNRLQEEFHALTEVAKTLASPLELPSLLDAVLRRIVEVVAQADVSAVMLWDQAAGIFRPEAAFGFNLEVLRQIGLRAGESITGKVYDAGRARLLATPQEVAEAMADMRPFNRDIFARSLQSDALPRAVLATPISTGEKKYGVLVLETLTAKDAFTDRDLPFIQTLADLIALAIDRHYLEAQLDTLRDARRTEYLRAEIMAILSHELRIPLSAIKGYSTALQLDEVEWAREKQQEFLGLIVDECDSMQVMLTEILELVTDRGGTVEPGTWSRFACTKSWPMWPRRRSGARRSTTSWWTYSRISRSWRSTGAGSGRCSATYSRTRCAIRPKEA